MKASHATRIGLLGLGLGWAACVVSTPPPEYSEEAPPPPPTAESDLPAERTPPQPVSVPAPEPEPYQPPTIPAADSRLTWSKPIQCRGNKALRLSGIRIEGAGPAVELRGNCSVEIVDSDLRSSSTAVQLHGNSRLILKRSLVAGAQSVRVKGNAELSARATRFYGGVDTVGNSSLRDLGDNLWAEGYAASPGGYSGAPGAPGGPAPMPPVRNPPAGGGALVRCSGNDTMRIDGKQLIAQEVSVEASGNCTMEIIGSNLQGRVALLVKGNADVVVRRSQIRGSEAAIRLRGNASLRMQESMVAGRFERVGQAEYQDAGGNRIQP